MPKILESATTKEDIVSVYTDEDVKHKYMHEDLRRLEARIRFLTKQNGDLRERLKVSTQKPHENMYANAFKMCVCEILRQQGIDEIFIEQEVTDSFVQSCLNNKLTVEEAVAVILF